MKTRKYISIVFVITALMAWSCGNDDNPGRGSDRVFEMLAGDWSIGTQGGITLDGEDVTLNFPGFTLSFADGTYQTTNGGTLFSANGTWEWADEAGRVLTLDTGEDITIIKLTVSEFEFSFFHTGNVRAGIQGNYVAKVFK